MIKNSLELQRSCIVSKYPYHKTGSWFSQAGKWHVISESSSLSWKKQLTGLLIHFPSVEAHCILKSSALSLFKYTMHPVKRENTKSTTWPHPCKQQTDQDKEYYQHQEAPTCSFLSHCFPTIAIILTLPPWIILTYFWPLNNWNHILCTLCYLVSCMSIIFNPCCYI